MYQDCISISSIVSAFLPYMHINMLLPKTALYAVLLTKLAKASRIKFGRIRSLLFYTKFSLLQNIPGEGVKGMS